MSNERNRYEGTATPTELDMKATMLPTPTGSAPLPTYRAIYTRPVATAPGSHFDLAECHAALAAQEVSGYATLPEIAQVCRYYGAYGRLYDRRCLPVGGVAADGRFTLFLRDPESGLTVAEFEGRVS